MQVRAASYGHTLGGAVGLFMIEARGLPMSAAAIESSDWQVQVTATPLSLSVILAPTTG